MRARPRPHPAVTVALVVAMAVAAMGAAAAALRSPAAPRVAAVPLPASVQPAFIPGPPRRLGSTRELSHWAPVRRRVSARAAPNAAARIVGVLTTRTPEGTRNAVAVLGRRQGDDGVTWVHIRLAVLPNGTTGWVPRAALGGYATVDTRLEVDLRRLRATLYRRGRPVLAAAIGTGMPAWPTPRGRFYIRNKLTRYRSPRYGPVAFGTSARSTVATDWPAGGFIGIHGTDRPDLLPGRVSHGCIRMRNADILALARRMPVGTPVTIR